MLVKGATDVSSLDDDFIFTHSINISSQAMTYFGQLQSLGFQVCKHARGYISYPVL